MLGVRWHLEQRIELGAGLEDDSDEPSEPVELDESAEELRALRAAS